VIGYLWFIFFFSVSFVIVHTLVLVLATVEVRRYAARGQTANLRVTLRSPLAPSISVLVPAYNEGPGIIDSVRSLLAMDYPAYEVIVIDDGSSDDTSEQLIKAFDLHRVHRPSPQVLPHQPVRAVYAPRYRLNLLLIEKENGGKADAMNAGICYSSADLFCSMDGDSLLEQDALAKTALPFIEYPDLTAATGGMVRIVNGCEVDHGRVTRVALPRNPIAMFQVVEYTRAFFGTRTGWTAINGLLIVSGAFGLFRREKVIAAGGYRADTLGEDLELAVRMHRSRRRSGQPYRIAYVPDPVCWTEGPENLHYLRKQRRRWQRGCIEALLFNRGMLFNPRYRVAGLLALPSMLLFEVLGPFVELSGYAVSLWAMLTGVIGVATYFLFLAFSVLYGLLLTFGSIVLEDVVANRFPAWEDLRRTLLYAVAENFGYRQLLHVWRIEAWRDVVRKPKFEVMAHQGFQPAGGPRSGTG
jgi:cellulose synthase/poly-beta-1,6-N-acetylglucosamine synthase-like glycosyltransferase